MPAFKLPLAKLAKGTLSRQVIINPSLAAHCGKLSVYNKYLPESSEQRMGLFVRCLVRDCNCTGRSRGRQTSQQKAHGLGHEHMSCLWGETGKQACNRRMLCCMYSCNSWQPREASRQSSNRRMPCCISTNLQLCDVHGKLASASWCTCASYTHMSRGQASQQGGLMWWRTRQSWPACWKQRRAGGACWNSASPPPRKRLKSSGTLLHPILGFACLGARSWSMLQGSQQR